MLIQESFAWNFKVGTFKNLAQLVPTLEGITPVGYKKRNNRHSQFLFGAENSGPAEILNSPSFKK